MEAKFVVFGTEQELRKHKMSEHKAELVEGLSRHERRAALTIPINLNVPPLSCPIACSHCFPAQDAPF